MAGFCRSLTTAAVKEEASSARRRSSPSRTGSPSAPMRVETMAFSIATKLSAGYREISYREANILERNSVGAYDIVLCTLTLHHFSDEDAVRVLQQCSELSRRFVLVSDLRRGFLLQAGVYLLTALIFREPMTRYDARLSAARAFSFSEMRDLALRAGWQNFGHEKFRFARQAIWLGG